MKKLIRLKEVSNITGLSRSTIYLYVDKGQFPKQVKLGERSVAWRLEEIYDWIDGRSSANE